MKAKGVMKNVGGSIVMQAVNVLTNLILPPMIISAYGSQVNGLTATITQIISYMSLVGAGLSVAATQAMFKPLAENDEETVSGMMKATGNMFDRVGILYLLISFVTAFLYPLAMKGDLQYFFMVLLMLIMSMSGAMEFFATGRYRSLLHADRKVYVYSLIQSACLIFSTMLAALSIRLGLSILWTQAMITAVYVLRAAGLSVYVKRHYPYLKKNSTPINECVAKRSDAMYHQFIGLIITGSQAILLSVFVGLEAASIYGVYNLVFAGLNSICIQISNSVVPYLGRSYAIGNREDVRNRFGLFEITFLVLITILLATSLIMITSFINLYTKKADIEYADALLAVMFVSRGFASTFRLPAQGMINAAGFFKETKKAATIEACICIVVELAAVQRWGIYGVMAGNLAAVGWRSFEMVFFTNRQILFRDVRPSIIRIGQAALSIVVSYFLARLVVPVESIAGWTGWILYACVSVAISAAVAFVIFLTTEKKSFSMIIKMLV